VIAAAWRATTRIETGVGNLVQRTGDDQAQVGYSVAGRLRGWVTLCVVYTMHKEMVSASKLRSTVSPGLASKPVATVLVV
jgi:hypothetical protein